MYDTVCFRDQFPEVESGSRIHKLGKPRTKEEETFRVQGADGTLLSLKTGSLIYRDDLVAVRARSNGIYVETSLARHPSAPRSPNVATLTSAEECAERVDQVEAHLYDLGLRLDLREAHLSAVHLAKDVKVEAPYEDYLLALQSCGLQRMSPADLKRYRNFHEKVKKQSLLPLGEHTYGRTWSNRANMVYSKIPRLMGQKAHRGYAGRVQRSIGEGSIVRFENRFTKAQSVKYHLGIETGQDLYERWDATTEKCAHLIDETFGPDDEAAAPVVDGLQLGGESSLMKAIVKKVGQGKSAVFIYFALQGLRAEAERAGIPDLEGARALFRAAGVRMPSIKEAEAELMDFYTQKEATVSALKRDLRNRLQGEAFAWPDS